MEATVPQWCRVKSRQLRLLAAQSPVTPAGSVPEISRRPRPSLGLYTFSVIACAAPPINNAATKLPAAKKAAFRNVEGLVMDSPFVSSCRYVGPYGAGHCGLVYPAAR